MSATCFETDYLRQCIGLCVAGMDSPFTVTQIVSLLNERHKFIGVDVSKAVSNELQRLQKHCMLESRLGVKGDDQYLVGRPPRVFNKVYCQRSLDVIRRRVVVDKISK
jgi:hypothetical protein